MLTGWTVAGKDGKLGTPGTFVFNANAHEPGPRRSAGPRLSRGGAAQGEAALDDLARHPATARHIAAQIRARLRRRRTPPGARRAADAKVFSRHDGDLGALPARLVDDDEAWSAPPTKLRDPWQMVMASPSRARPGGRRSRGRSCACADNLLGQPLWTPAVPTAFSDASEAWLSPEGVKMRVEIAPEFARRWPGRAGPPGDLIARVLPDASSRHPRAPCCAPRRRSRPMRCCSSSPEFQRR